MALGDVGEDVVDLENFREVGLGPGAVGTDCVFVARDLEGGKTTISPDWRLQGGLAGISSCQTRR